MGKAYSPIFLSRESHFKWTEILSFAYNVEIVLEFTWDLNTDFFIRPA